MTGRWVDLSSSLFDRATALIQKEYGETIEDLARLASLQMRDTVDLVRRFRDQRPKLLV